MVEAIQAIREMVAVMLQQTNQRNEEVAEFQGLSEFRRNNPSEFAGGYGPEKADLWIQEMEKIFCAMTCTNRQKVTFATYMLVDEAKYWWDSTRRLLEVVGVEVTQEVFKNKFVVKYFPDDVKRAKEIKLCS